MASSRFTHLVYLVSVFFICAMLSFSAYAENDEDYLSEEPVNEASDRYSPPPSKRSKEIKRRKYFTNQEPRIDSGVFHVGIAVGGNFYIEPEYNHTTKALTGEWHRDFGFQAGVYFDWNYSELDENIPLGLRSMVGYKYILNSVHVFTFDGVIRRMWQFSENSAFGFGFGGSAAVWYRVSDSTSGNEEEILFLPSFILSAGFEFTPFMADFKFLLNRWAADVFIGGIELYFGFRL